MNKITVKQIMSHGLCSEYPESRVIELIGDGKTPLEILDLDISAEDRIYVLTREGIIPDHILREFAVRCAEPAIEILAGKIIDHELNAVKFLAYDVARAATRAAALNAANAATTPAEWWEALSDAWSSARAEQIEIMRDILSKEI